MLSDRATGVLLRYLRRLKNESNCFSGGQESLCPLHSNDVIFPRGIWNSISYVSFFEMTCAISCCKLKMINRSKLTKTQLKKTKTKNHGVARKSDSSLATKTALQVTGRGKHKSGVTREQSADAAQHQDFPRDPQPTCCTIRSLGAWKTPGPRVKPGSTQLGPLGLDPDTDSCPGISQSQFGIPHYYQ